MDNYTPQKNVDNTITFALNLGYCKKCGRNMVVKPREAYGVFPHYYANNFEAQAKRANLVIQSTIKVDGCYICIECEKMGKADFECYLCKKRKSTKLIQERFGDPAEYLCFECYETVSAKIWEETVDKLYDIHKYDFE